MYATESPPMVEVKVKASVYKKVLKFNLRRPFFETKLVLLKGNLEGVLRRQPNGKFISLTVGILVFDYDPISKAFIYGDKIALLYLKVESHLRLL